MKQFFNKCGFHLIFLACIGLLCSLGIWQLHRRDWKNAIVAEIATKSAAPPLTSHWLDIAKPAEYMWRKLALSATCPLQDLFFLQGKFYHGQAGVNAVCPARLANGKTLLVNFGWLSQDNAITYNQSVRPPQQLPPLSFTAVGLLKPFGTRPWYLPPDQPAQHHIIMLQQPPNSYPAYVDVLPGQSPQDSWWLSKFVPQGAPPELRNEHLAYAITWFTLALIAAIVYVAKIYSKSGAPKSFPSP